MWCGVFFGGLPCGDARGKARDAGRGSSLPNYRSGLYSRCLGGMQIRHESQARTLGFAWRWPPFMPTSPFKTRQRGLWAGGIGTVRGLASPGDRNPVREIGPKRRSPMVSEKPATAWIRSSAPSDTVVTSASSEALAASGCSTPSRNSTTGCRLHALAPAVGPPVIFLRSMVQRSVVPLQSLWHC